VTATNPVYLLSVLPLAALLSGWRTISFRLETDWLMQIIVRDNNVDQALRALKKKLQREGVYREMKLRRHYEKPSEKRAREKAAAIRRARKLERKRVERDGGK
jgi:small subunit ribosomal protein S21